MLIMRSLGREKRDRTVHVTEITSLGGVTPRWTTGVGPVPQCYAGADAFSGSSLYRCRCGVVRPAI